MRKCQQFSPKVKDYIPTYSELLLYCMPTYTVWNPKNHRIAKNLQDILSEGGSPTEDENGQPFLGGRYQQIDFHLSNRACASILHIGIIPRHNYLSLLNDERDVGDVHTAVTNTFSTMFRSRLSVVTDTQ